MFCIRLASDAYEVHALFSPCMLIIFVKMLNKNELETTVVSETAEIDDSFQTKQQSY